MSTAPAPAAAPTSQKTKVALNLAVEIDLAEWADDFDLPLEAALEDVRALATRAAIHALNEQFHRAGHEATVSASRPAWTAYAMPSITNQDMYRIYDTANESRGEVHVQDGVVLIYARAGLIERAPLTDCEGDRFASIAQRAYWLTRATSLFGGDHVTINARTYAETGEGEAL